MKEKRKFKLSANLFWLLPLMAVIFIFCLQLFFGYTKIEELRGRDISSASCLLLFFYVLVWILVSIYQKSGKDDRLKKELSNSMITGMLLLLTGGVFALLGFNSDFIIIAFAMAASQIFALPYYLYKILN